MAPLSELFLPRNCRVIRRFATNVYQRITSGNVNEAVPSFASREIERDGTTFTPTAASLSVVLRLGGRGRLLRLASAPALHPDNVLAKVFHMSANQFLRYFHFVT
jgi:hypothetical protein